MREQKCIPPKPVSFSKGSTQKHNWGLSTINREVKRKRKNHIYRK